MKVAISTYQYPLLTSDVENTADLSSKALHSSIRVTGYGSRYVEALSLLWSAQNRSVPSFFGAKIVGADHSVCTGFVTFCSVITSISSFSKFLVLRST